MTTGANKKGSTAQKLGTPKTPIVGNKSAAASGHGKTSTPGRTSSSVQKKATGPRPSPHAVRRNKENSGEPLPLAPRSKATSAGGQTASVSAGTASNQAEGEQETIETLKAQLEQERKDREEEAKRREQAETQLQESRRKHAEELAAAEAAAAGGGVPDVDDEIKEFQKPKGEAGSSRGYNLIEAMGLDKTWGEDKVLYQRIRAAVRRNSARAGINFNVSYKHIPAEQLALTFKLGRKQFDYLARKRFPADWAQAAMLKEYVTNQRKRAKRLGGGASDDDEDQQSNTGADDNNIDMDEPGEEDDDEDASGGEN